MPTQELKEAILRVAEENSADVYLYAGGLHSGSVNDLINCRPENPKQDALLLLYTNGGDAHEAYKLTRFFRAQYSGEFTIFLPSVCKSAGTLVAIGADKVIMSPQGELGPLDVQISERDELWEYRSGLIPSQALKTIREEAMDFFIDCFLRLRAGTGLQLTTRTSVEMAADATIGLFEPLLRQVDPLRVAEIYLSMRIAEEYSNRLNSRNVKEGAVRKLVYEYPSHNFVIDYQEASDLFEIVELSNVAEDMLHERLQELDINPRSNQPIAACLSDPRFLQTVEVTPESETIGSQTEPVESEVGGSEPNGEPEETEEQGAPDIGDASGDGTQVQEGTD